MHASLQLTLTLTEADILKKALNNYIGKIDYVTTKVDVSYEELTKLNNEKDLTLRMLKQLI